MYDINEVKSDARELIPTGTPLFVEMTFTPGGFGPQGLLTKSKPTPERPNPDTAYLKCEFTVLRGPYKARKFWSNLTLVGGEVDEHGRSKALNIALQAVRRIIESAFGLRSDDMTPKARDIRSRFNFADEDMRGLQGLNGIRFVTLAAVSKERAGFAQKNELGGHWNIMTIDSKRWPSEHDLDHPQTGKPAAPAPAAPVWSTPSGAPGAPQTGGLSPQTGFTAPSAGSHQVQADNQPFGNSFGQPPATPAAPPANSDMPKWMLQQ